MKVPKDLIRQIEAAELIGVTRQHMNKLVRLHKIKSYTVGRLVSKTEVLAYKKNKD